MSVNLEELGIRAEARLLFEPYLDRVTCTINPFGRHTVLCHTVLEAAAFVSVCHQINLEDICFIITGLTLNNWPLRRPVALVFGHDVLGALWDIKVAGMISKQQISISYEERFVVRWRNRAFYFDDLTLNAFERASGFRSGVRTYKPKGYPTYLEQLKQQHGKSYG